MSEEEREYTREIIGTTKSVIKFFSSTSVALFAYIYLSYETLSTERQWIVYLATLACILVVVGGSWIYRSSANKLKIRS